MVAYMAARGLCKWCEKFVLRYRLRSTRFETHLQDLQAEWEDSAVLQRNLHYRLAVSGFRELRLLDNPDVTHIEPVSTESVVQNLAYVAAVYAQCALVAENHQDLIHIWGGMRKLPVSDEVKRALHRRVSAAVAQRHLHMWYLDEDVWIDSGMMQWRRIALIHASVTGNPTNQSSAYRFVIGQIQMLMFG